jgi:DNA adenine methylase
MVPQPIVQWAGGKKKLLDYIKKNLPSDFGDYHEPFLGSGIVCLNQDTNRPKYVNDMNECLVRTYEAIQSDVHGFTQCLKTLQDSLLEDYTRDDFKVKYRALREEFNLLKNKNQKTQEDLYRMCALFLFLNKNCFCAVYRENSRGEFNVPAGKYNRNFFNTDHIQDLSAFLQNVSISNVDFETFCIGDKVKPNDFVFLDPPYDPLSKGALTKYTKNDFTEEDQRRVLKVCNQIDQKGAFFMVCNSNTPLIRELFREYNVEEFVTNVCLNSKADNRKGAYREVVIKNY